MGRTSIAGKRRNLCMARVFGDPGADACGIDCLKLSMILCIEIAALEQLTLSTVLIVD